MAQQDRDVQAGTMLKVVYALNNLAHKEEIELSPDIREHPDTKAVVNNVLKLVSNRCEERLQQEAKITTPRRKIP